MSDTVDRCRRLLASISQDAFVAYNYEDSDRATLRYLTGFTGEGALIVASEGSRLLTDSRYTEQARLEAIGAEVLEIPVWTKDGLAEQLRDLGVRSACFASSRVTYRWVEGMRDVCTLDFVPAQDPVLALRRTKSEAELAALRRAARIAESALERLLDEIRVGMTEAEIGLRLEWLIREAPGAEGIAFETNVSAGAHTALNHYNPYHKPQPIAPGQLLLIDFGARVDGYNSDITRTFSVGAPAEDATVIYDLVLRANEAAIDAARAGLTGIELDAVARDLIRAAGHGDHFGHGLGHGLGLEVHEAPRLSPRSEDVLEANMVATIEPGIYLPGVGGVRIEDDVVLSPDGCEVITRFPKDRLLEVG